MSEYTSAFQDVRGLSGFNYTTAGTQPSEKGVAPAQRNTLRTWAPGTWSREEQAQFGMWEIVLRDFSLQGLNHPEGLFSMNSNGFMASNLITGEPNSMHLSPTVAVNAAPIVTGDIIGLHHVFAFGSLVVGAGSGANVSLWKETSTSDSTPSPITYSPAASICSLSRVVDDGVERVAVGRIGAAVQLLSDAIGTVNLTMHTSTNSCWGIIVSGVNATTAGVPVMLIYAGTSIGTKATDADLTTAITVTQTVRAGGFAIGAITPKGRDQRAFWAIPKATNAAGALKYGAEALMEIMSTNMEAGDLLPFTSNYCPHGIYGAVPWRDGFVFFDDTHVCYWDGQEEFDLSIFDRRIGAASETWVSNTINSDVRRRVRALIPNGPDLYAWSNVYRPSGQTMIYMMEKYKFETGTWHGYAQAFGSVGTSAVASGYLCGQGGMPWSPNTSRAQNYETVDPRGWMTYYVSRPAESLLWQHSLGTGASTTNVPLYFNDGRFLGPEWKLDGIVRNPKVVTETEFDGNLNHGGTAAYTVTVKVSGHPLAVTAVATDLVTASTATFAQGGHVNDYKRQNNGWANVWDLQVLITTDAVLGSDLRTNIEILPITLRGLYAKDGKPITQTHCPSEFA